MNSFLANIIADNKKILACLAVVAVTGYAIILPTPFKTMDDLVSIVNNPRIQHWDRLGEIFTTSFFTEKAYYRPLVLVSFMIEYHLFGLKSFFYNLNNVLLHIANAFLVFHIVLILLTDRRMAFASGLLFALHPIHWEAVANIPGRSIVLCSFFFLLGFYYFLQSETKPASPRTRVYTIAAFVLALLSKESAVMFPFCLTAYYGLVKKKFDRRTWLNLAPFAVILVAYFCLRRWLGITAMTPWNSAGELLLGVGSFLRVCLYYTGQILLPVNLYYDHTSPLATSAADPLLWGALLVWAAVIGAVYFFRERIPRPLMFCGAWIVLNLVTVSQLVPIRSPGGRISTPDHFLYLPLLGAIAIGVYAAERFLRNAKLKNSIKTFMVAGYAVFLFLVLLQHNFYASNQIAMFQRALEHDPGNTRVRNSLAVIYGYAGKYADAEFHYREAVRRDPDNTQALIGLGQSLADQGRFEEALTSYRQVRDPRAFRGRHRQNLLYVYEQLVRQARENGDIGRAAALERTLAEIKATKN